MSKYNWEWWVVRPPWEHQNNHLCTLGISDRKGTVWKHYLPNLITTQNASYRLASAVLFPHLCSIHISVVKTKIAHTPQSAANCWNIFTHRLREVLYRICERKVMRKAESTSQISSSSERLPVTRWEAASWKPQEILAHRAKENLQDKQKERETYEIPGLVV